MGNKEKRICRLCLKTSEDFERIETTIKEMFDILVVQVNWHVSEDPVICKNCAENIQKFVDFKTTCIRVEDSVDSLAVAATGTLGELHEVHLSKNKNTDAAYYTICRFCTKYVERDHCMYFDKLKKEVVFVEDMLSKYIPEIDLTITKTPVICEPCKDSLEGYLNFIMNCEDVEDKIDEYCKAEEVLEKDQVKLSDVQEFILKKLSDGGCTLVDIAKKEDKFFENDEYEEAEIKYNNLIQLEELELNIKDEEAEVNEDNDSNRFMDNTSILPQSDILKRLLTSKNASNIITHKYQVYATDTENPQKHTQDISAMAVADEPSQCKAQNEYLRYLLLAGYDNKGCTSEPKFQHLGMPEDVPTVYQCAMCRFKTKHKNSLTTHMLNHKDISEDATYQCEMYEFKTKHKHSLKKHIRIHEGGLKVHQCSMCEYKTQYGFSFRRHSLIHKAVSEVTAYQCETCNFKTKHKNNLIKHMILHKNKSEIESCKCKVCGFETNYSRSLERHIMLTHKGAAEVTMYQCKTCKFETKYKNNLKKHLLTHKDDVKMYQCKMCDYETNNRHCLKRHMLSHNTAFEASVYQCEQCKYKTKQEQFLKQHKLIHEDASEIMHQCVVCDYNTKNKHSLRKHMLVHKDTSEVTMYQCELCVYKTKRKGSLKQHMLVHKAPADVTMYHCEICEYKTKYKNYLKEHILTHKDVSEVTMHQCQMCEYKTKYKKSLRFHMLMHKDVFDVQNRCDVVKNEPTCKDSAEEI